MKKEGKAKIFALISHARNLPDFTADKHAGRNTRHSLVNRYCAQATKNTNGRAVSRHQTVSPTAASQDLASLSSSKIRISARANICDSQALHATH